jgi:hypothetical protein
MSLPTWVLTLPLPVMLTISWFAGTEPPTTIPPEPPSVIEPPTFTTK